jgi:hypothetical protein
LSASCGCIAQNTQFQGFSRIHGVLPTNDKLKHNLKKKAGQ